MNILPIVDMNTPDGTNGTANTLKETGIRLCQEIATIEGLPGDFVSKVNGEANSIVSKSFGTNEDGSDHYNADQNNGFYAVNREHRVTVCNYLNELKLLLQELKAEPKKYNWDSVSQVLLSKNTFENCDGGRANAISQLITALKGVKNSKDGIGALVQTKKEEIIDYTCNTIGDGDNRGDVHYVQKMKHRTYSQYGLPYAPDDSVISWWAGQFINIQNELKCIELKEYVASEKFFKDFIGSVMSDLELHPVVSQEDASRANDYEEIANKKKLFENSKDRVMDEILLKNGFTQDDQAYIYKTGESKEWNANINHVIKLHYIRQMLPLGIFSDETQKKLSTLTSPKMMRFLLVLGQNVQSEEEKEGFVQNPITCEYEKPNSDCQLPEFYSYGELIKHLGNNKDKIEHLKEPEVNKLLTEVIAEQNSKLPVVLNLDSYQITRLAHIIAKGERKNETVEYRKLDELLKTPLVKDKLLEIAEEVKRIEEKNGVTRTLEQCFYAVCDFFRYILGYSTLDKHTKRDSETFLYATEGAVTEDLVAPEKQVGSFTQLMGLKDAVVAPGPVVESRL